MNIAFFCIPAHGHTNPTLAVVRELTARGHTVRYYTTEAFRARPQARSLSPLTPRPRAPA